MGDKSSLAPHQDKSYLQNRGAAILAAGNKYVNQSNLVNNQRQIQQIYGAAGGVGNHHGGMPTHAQKPPIYNNNKYHNNGYVDRSNLHSALH